MDGTRDLATLLATLDPELSDVEVVFCTVPDMVLADALKLSPTGVFREREGLSLIIARTTAESRGMPFDAVFQAITLKVHSSLEAVGLTAAVADRLAQHGISANVVAACYHDHVFVPVHDAQRAVEILRMLQAEVSDGHALLSSSRDHTGLTGSCLCGAVRYQVDQLDAPIVHCHCATCRKAHAAAYTSTAGVLRMHFRWTAGQDRIAAFESSPGKLRLFCTTCGTHLIAERPAEPHVILRVATLDDDPATRPAMHIWTSHDRPWLTEGAWTPRYPEWPPGR